MICANMRKLKNACFKSLTNKMTIYFNVVGVFMKHMIFRNLYGCLIVIKELHGLLMEDS